MDFRQYSQMGAANNEAPEKFTGELRVTVSGPDFCITKETSRSTRTLAVILSRGVIFIRDEKTGNDIPADVNAITRFIDRDVELVDSETGVKSWLGVCYKGKAFADFLFILVTKKECENVRRLIQHGYIVIPVNSTKDGIRTPTNLPAECEPYIAACLAVFDEEQQAAFRVALGEMALRFCAPETSDTLRYFENVMSVFRNVASVNAMIGVWAPADFAEFVLASLNGPLKEFLSEYNVQKIMPLCQSNGITCNQFCMYAMYNWLPGTYTLSDAVGTFCRYLTEGRSLLKSLGIDAPIFPEDFVMTYGLFKNYHTLCTSYHLDIYKGSLDLVSKHRDIFEYHEKDYVLLVPHDRLDISLEAIRLKNSVYKDSVRDGKMVFFCRKASALDEPFVSVLVNMDGTVDRICPGHTTFGEEIPIEPEVLDFICRWHEKVFGGGSWNAE